MVTRRRKGPKHMLGSAYSIENARAGGYYTERDVTKIGMDYAEFLIRERD